MCRGVNVCLARGRPTGAKGFAYQAKELGVFPVDLWDTDKVSEVTMCFQRFFLCKVEC